MIVRLESGSFLSAPGEKKGNVLEKQAMLVYTGKFQSMDGEVEIKDLDLDKLSSNHNSILKKAARLASGEPNPKVYPPIQLDHSKSARDTVGRLIGDLTVGEHELSDGTKVKALLGTVRVLGAENVEKVEDGRWAHLSIGADLKKHLVSELTITPFPAAAEASLLSKGDTEMGYKEMQEKMGKYAKARKHLTEQKKMSEEDADKHLESAKDEEVKKMAEEHDEHEKKMASKLAEEKDDKEKKDKDEKMSRMTAAQENLKKMMTDFRSETTALQLKAKEATISVRLSRLTSAGKLTPAERKKINLTELAGQNEATVNAVIESYEKREPVIIPGQFGGTKAADPAQVAADMKRMSKENLELETLANMPMLKAQLTANNDPRITKLAGGPDKDAGPSEAGYAAKHDRHMSSDKELEKDYETLSQLMDEGKHEEAKAHCKKMKEKMKKMASPAEEHMASEAEEQMSALAKQFASMQTKFEKIQELVSQS